MRTLQNRRRSRRIVVPVRLPITWKTAVIKICAAIALITAVGASSCPAAVRVEAYRGEPFGVGRVTVDLEQGASSDPWSDDRFTLSEVNGRVFYPAIDHAPVRRLV